MSLKTDYKTFTAHIETATLLDGFVPDYIEDIKQRFYPIERQQEKLSECINRYASELKSYQEFVSTVQTLNNTAAHINIVFEDFKKRMDYFSIIFFGAVSAGKTSMICDLARMNPNDLTDIISKQPNFDFQKDEILIGPNVATINLYEILINKSRIRLVDVPGLGGVVHKNDSLAPFVDMADVVVFVLDANSDITKDDYDFIYDHVAAVDQLPTRGNNSSGFTTEKGLEKKALVIINKWNSTYQNRPPAHSEKDWERKSEWILHGNHQKNFSGIAELFSKPPIVVRANTSFRDDETGECYPDSAGLFSMDEVVTALKDILQDEGAVLRLNRPRQILIKEIGKLIEQLYQEKTSRSYEDFLSELEDLGFKIESTSQTLFVQFDSRLNHLEENIRNILSPQIKRVINNWKPKVSLVNQLKMIVPPWFPGASKSGWTKEQVQEVIKEVWQTEIQDLIKSHVDSSRLEAIVKQEAETLAILIASGFRVELAEASPQLRKNLAALNAAVKTDSIGKDQTATSLKAVIYGVANKVESEILNDLLAILTFDVLLAALAGAVLTPAGSFAIALMRRWRRGDKKEREIRQEVESAVDEAVATAAMNIRHQVADRLHQGIEKTEKEIRKVLEREQNTLGKPLQVIDRAIDELKKHQEKLESMTLKNKM
jgi:signal recognition particle receptor subunit beta/predicted transcriptional regulator